MHPVYYRHICEAGAKKFARFATEVWGIQPEGRSEIELARMGVEALADFFKENSLPTTLRELDVPENIDLKAIADSCAYVPGAYKVMTHEGILKIYRDAYKNFSPERMESGMKKLLATIL